MSFSLSVVIPSHNRPDLLAACLASVQRYAPTGTEILVVDDGSPDGIARRAADGIRVLRLPRRRGFCVAANAGLRAARGEIVELLNDDTEVTAGWAQAALAVFADQSVAAVAPLVLLADKETRRQGDKETATDKETIRQGDKETKTDKETIRQGDKETKTSFSLSPCLLVSLSSRIDSAGDRYYLGGVAGKRGHGERLRPRYLGPCRVFGASASSAFYRREAVLQVGAFPEDFGAYFEDVDLAFRLNRAGWQVRYEPASRVSHRGHSSYGRPTRRLLEQQSQNEERVFWRNLTTSALPRHLIVLAGKAWRRWQEGNLAPFLCGRLRAFGELPDLIRHQREFEIARSDRKGAVFARPSGRGSHSPTWRDWQVETRFWG